MPVSIMELNDLINSSHYAHFINTNLHLHTPSTSWDWDSQPNQTQKAATLTPELYFDALNKTSLELVAVTDHNSVSWCKSLIQLSQKARREGRSKLFILPGVEITTYEGPHLIAIFDENQDLVDEIKKMLIRLGLSGEGRQDDRVGKLTPKDEVTIPKILDEVEYLGGIIVGPHVHQKDGLWGSKEFRGRNTILNDKRIRILAAPSGEIKRVSDGPDQIRLLYKNMDSSIISNSYGFINVSDCHRTDDFEINTTWIKMTTPCLNGVRQIIYEPELRVSNKVEKSAGKAEFPETMHFTKPDEITHPYLIAISITGGMLDGQKIVFSPNQNSIIGKNYAGKSAILDCIRFVLNNVPNDIDVHDKFADRMRAFVGDGGEVRAYIKDHQGNLYGISRTHSCTRLGRGGNAKWQIEGIPIVYKLWNNEFKRESDITLEDVIHLEVYPQGEVIKIKDNANKQMKIVDTLANIDLSLLDLTTLTTNSGKTLLGNLNVNSKNIISYFDRLNVLSEEIKNINQLQKEIGDLEKLTTSPLFGQKKEWAEVEVTIDEFRGELNRLNESWSLKTLLSSLSPNSDEDEKKDDEKISDESKTFDPENAFPFEFTKYASEIFFPTAELIRKSIEGNIDALKKASTALFELEAKRKNREGNVEEEIRKSLQSSNQGIEESGLIDRITEKRRRLNELEQKQRELTTTKGELDEFIIERISLLAQFKDKWEQIRIARREIVKTIDLRSASNIKAEMVEGADRENYRKLLNEIVDGLSSATNKIQNKESQLDIIVDNITPEQLIMLVKNGNANSVCELVPEVKLNTSKILLAMGQADIHNLEQCILGDKFVISFKKKGDEIYTPIETGLSGGEQALALISIAMVPKHLPLIIDQPEDELGPALITHELVDQIRNVKSVRQMIFVTHIPNIPVLADSEQILYIEQKITSAGKVSEINSTGSLDQLDIVKHLLELDGGDLAFKKRSERYSSVMNNEG